MNKLAIFILSLLLKFIKYTSRKTYHHQENMDKARSLSAYNVFVIAVWHQNLAASILTLKHMLISMTSRSKDGGYAANVAKKFNIIPTRGSSSRGGKEAMMEMIKLIKEHKEPAGLTVDGPRGPAKVPKRGVFKIAYESKSPVLPLYAVSTRMKSFEKSWDKFRLPLPFGHFHVFYGEPIEVTDLSDEAIEGYSKRLIETKLKLEEEASKYL